MLLPALFRYILLPRLSKQLSNNYQKLALKILFSGKEVEREGQKVFVFFVIKVLLKFLKMFIDKVHSLRFTQVESKWFYQR